MAIVQSKSVIPLQVSKWIKIPLLIDLVEMEHLLHSLPPFFLYDIQRVVGSKEGIYSPTYLLEAYGSYINALKRGEGPNLESFRAPFSMAWSIDEGALYEMATPDHRRLLKAAYPVLQSQMNAIRYAPEEKIFRTQIFGSDTITWGIQVGFPFLFMDPKTCEAEKTNRFPNMSLFSAFQQWVRKETVATPFLIDQQQLNSPIRLGKKCFSWIGNHPQLKALGIAVKI